MCVCVGGSTCYLVLITVGILSSESGGLVDGLFGPHSGVFSIVLCAQNIPECVGHSIGQDPGVTPCSVWEGRGATGCFMWRIHSLFLLEPVYLFTSLLGVDLVINTLALRCWWAYKSGSHVCFRLAHLSEECTVLYAMSQPCVGCHSREMLRRVPAPLQSSSPLSYQDRLLQALCTFFTGSRCGSLGPYWLSEGITALTGRDLTGWGHREEAWFYALHISLLMVHTQHHEGAGLEGRELHHTQSAMHLQLCLVLALQ